MENLDQHTLWRGSELANQNAHTLMAVAQDAAHRQAFGAAASLVVLGAEEAAKALGLATQALSHRSDPLHLRKYFRDHKHKHDAGTVFLGVMEFYSLLTSEVNALEADRAVAQEEKGSLLVNRMIALAGAELSGEHKTFESVNSWRKSADLIKKRGFYIDWDGGAWSVPDEIEQDSYETQRKRAESLLQLSDVLVALGYENARSEYEKVNSKIGDRPRFKSGTLLSI